MKTFKCLADQLTRSAEVLALLFGLSLCCPLRAQQVTVLRNFNLINGTGAVPPPSRTVIIAGNRIQSISPRPANPPAGATVIDMQGRTVMPLMINTHYGTLEPGKKANLQSALSSRPSIIEAPHTDRPPAAVQVQCDVSLTLHFERTRLNEHTRCAHRIHH